MIDILHSVTDKLKTELGKDVISLLDSSCGDMFWMPEFLEKRKDVDYTGFDLADGNIASNKEKFGSRGWTFKVSLFLIAGMPVVFNILHDSNMIWSKTTSSGAMISSSADTP